MYSLWCWTVYKSLKFNLVKLAESLCNSNLFCMCLFKVAQEHVSNHLWVTEKVSVCFLKDQVWQHLLPTSWSDKTRRQEESNVSLCFYFRPFNTVERKSSYGVIDCDQNRKDVTVKTGGVNDKASRKTYTFDMVSGSRRFSLCINLQTVHERFVRLIKIYAAVLYNLLWYSEWFSLISLSGSFLFLLIKHLKTVKNVKKKRKKVVLLKVTCWGVVFFADQNLKILMLCTSHHHKWVTSVGHICLKMTRTTLLSKWSELNYVIISWLIDQVTCCCSCVVTGINQLIILVNLRFYMIHLK